jgi:hypothetical protein
MSFRYVGFGAAKTPQPVIGPGREPVPVSYETVTARPT